MVHLISRLYRRKLYEVRRSSNVDTESVLDEAQGSTVPNKETKVEDTSAEPASVMRHQSAEADNGTPNQKSNVKPKSKRFWKFLNSLVPKMLESESEDEEDDLGEPEEDESTGLAGPALSKLTPAEQQEEQEDGNSILSELAFELSLRDGAENTLTGLKTGCDDTIEETKKGWEAEVLPLLTDRLSRQPKRGSAPLGLQVQACRGEKDVGGGKVSSVGVVAKDDHATASSLAQHRSAEFLSDPNDSSSSSGHSQCRESINHSTSSLLALDTARTEEQPTGEPPLEEVKPLTDDGTDLPKAVIIDEPGRPPLESGDITGDESSGSQSRPTELAQELRDRHNIICSKTEDVGSAEEEHFPITPDMRARVKADLLRNSLRIPPAIIEQLLDDTSLISWHRRALSAGRNPFLSSGNLRYVRPGLEEAWTKFGSATILPFNLSAESNPTSPSDTSEKSLFRKLPPELRKKIYFHVFQLQDTHKEHEKSGMQGHIETALLQICRSIYFEARCIPLQANEVQFRRSMYAVYFVNRLSTPQRRCLRSVLVRSEITDFYFDRLKTWENMFNAFFGMYAYGTRLRTFTVVIAGTWDVSFERMVEERWALLANALHYIDDFYFSIEDPEVSYEIKANLHTKWATFFTGHARDWPPFGVAHTSPIGTTFVPAPDAELNSLDPSNSSLTEDPSATDGDLDGENSSAEAVAETLHSHTATMEDGPANNLILDPIVVDINADVAGSSDNNELWPHLSNIGASRITEILDDERPEHFVSSPAPNHSQLAPAEDRPYKYTSTKSSNKTPTISKPTTPHIPSPKRQARPHRYQPPHKRLRLRLLASPPTSTSPPPCPLLTLLTPHLRALIYAYIFPIHDQTPAWHPRYFLGHIETALLLANRQIWQETHLLPAALNTFTFACPAHARLFLQYLPRALHASVKRIRVSATADSFRWEYGREAWRGLFTRVQMLQQGGLGLERMEVEVTGVLGVGFEMDVIEAWGGLGRTLFSLERFEMVFEDERVGSKSREMWERVWARWLVFGVVDG